MKVISEIKFKKLIKEFFPKPKKHLLENSGFCKNHMSFDGLGGAMVKVRDDDKIYGWIFVDVEGNGHGYMMNQRNPETKAWKPFTWTEPKDLNKIFKELKQEIKVATRCRFQKSKLPLFKSPY